jgi:hypothetical protein
MYGSHIAQPGGRAPRMTSVVSDAKKQSTNYSVVMPRYTSENTFNLCKQITFANTPTCTCTVGTKKSFRFA